MGFLTGRNLPVVSMAPGVKVRLWSRAEHFSHSHHLARAATAPASLVTLARWEGENVSGTGGVPHQEPASFQDKKNDLLDNI